MAALAKPVGYSPGQFFATANLTNPTTTRLRAVQDQNVDWKAKIDELQGAEHFALATATGPISVTGKVNFGMSNIRAWSDLLSGDAVIAGKTSLAQDEIGALITHAYTVVNTGAVQDRGVVNKLTNQPYVRVAAASEVAGASYSFANGTYTFAVAETGTQFYFTYLYSPASPVSGTGTITLANTLQGPTTNFQVDQVFPFGTDQDILSLFNCAASDMNVSAKQGFAGSSLGFTAAVNDSGQLGQFSFAHAA